MTEKILTHRTEPQGYRLCKCAKCGIIRRCTPSFDFYVNGGDETLALWCETCFMTKHFGKEIPLVETAKERNQVGDTITIKENGKTCTAIITAVDDEGRPISWKCT